MLNASRTAELLAPYTDPVGDSVLGGISKYVDLLLRWNQRTNLTAIRDPEHLVQRQIGESLFAMRFLQPDSTLLDFGSGAGFPGIPLAIAVPALRVTLAESQGKKASFLREAVRTLGVSIEVWSGRVEAMPSERQFDTVVMRAVDHSTAMLPMACERVAPRGSLLRYVSADDALELSGWVLTRSELMPLSGGRLASWSRAKQ